MTRDPTEQEVEAVALALEDVMRYRYVEPQHERRNAARVLAKIALSAMSSGWRPISEVEPFKDGSEIVLYGPCRPRNSTSRYARDANVGWWSDGRWHTRVGGETCDATHFLVLPSPPEPTP